MYVISSLENQLQSQMLCSSCSIPFSPTNSCTRTLTPRQLKRRRRRAHIRGQSLSSLVHHHCRTYVVSVYLYFMYCMNCRCMVISLEVVHCKVCGTSTVLGGNCPSGFASTRNHFIPSNSPATTNITTPRSHATMAVNSTNTTSTQKRKRWGFPGFRLLCMHNCVCFNSGHGLKAALSASFKLEQRRAANDELGASPLLTNFLTSLK